MIIRLMIIGAVLLTGRLGFALTTEEVLADIRQKTDPVSSNSYTGTSHNYLSNEVIEWKIFIKKPYFSRHETISSIKGTTVYLDDGEWREAIYNGEVFKSPKAEQGKVDFFPISDQDLGVELGFVREDVVDGQEVYILEKRKPPEIDLQELKEGFKAWGIKDSEAEDRAKDQVAKTISRVEYVIRKADGMLLKRTSYAVTGKVLSEETYRDYQLNIDLPMELFHFVHSEGAGVDQHQSVGQFQEAVDQGWW